MNTSPPGVHFAEAAAPDGMRLYAIGDVHGRADLLARLHERIGEEIARDQPPDWRIIYLGDYVDRGADSRGVIDFLLALLAEDERHVALMGNHDERMAMFIRDVTEWPNFRSFGGLETALSYGVDFALRGDVEAGHRVLAAAVPADHVAFLESLPLSASFGDFFFCHAGIRPGIPLDRQSREDLLWIRQDFHRHQGLHPKVIVHGHTPVAAPEILPNRVNLDTLAYESGRLTALVVDGREKRLLSTEE
jgi:serine/threonine protein phosphatase 1